MVALNIERVSFVPPERWMFPLESETELGRVLARLRKDRGLTQAALAQLVDPAQANDPKAMHALKTQLSRHETGATKEHNQWILERLEQIYELPAMELGVLAARDDRLRTQRERVARESVIIPNEPALLDAVSALFLLEPENLPDATKQIRNIANVAAGGEGIRPAADEQAAS